MEKTRKQNKTKLHQNNSRTM